MSPSSVNVAAHNDANLQEMVQVRMYVFGTDWNLDDLKLISLQWELEIERGLEQVHSVDTLSSNGSSSQFSLMVVS